MGAEQHGGDEEFLRAYYDALRGRLERKLAVRPPPPRRT
jgi:hypothetical protein